MHAAIDIGTNSIHLVVARANPNGGFDVVTTEKESVRLGSGPADLKALEPDAIDRGIAALGRMITLAESFGAEITAVATSAVREAANRDEFVDRARAELGLEIDVISGYEEARLIHHGVIHAVPVAGRRVLVVDIGGGSTEFIVGEGRHPIEARSLRLGAIRLTERFVAPGPDGERPAPEAVDACRAYLRDALTGVSRDLGGHQPELAIGSSGTITAVATMIAATRGATPKQMNGFSFTADEVAAVAERVVSSSVAERRAMRGLDDRRVDIIAGGVLLLDEVFRSFELEAMTISAYALREGVLYDRFPAGPDHLYDLRRSNALALARDLDPDPEHAEAVARLAVQIFDRTTALHGLDGWARELLEIAALVHNVGEFIARSGHHKHAYYVIRNSERLTGFSEREVELVAVVARYHRKSHPTPKHAEYARLPQSEQRLVSILAGMLRIAIGLDRRHGGIVPAVRVHHQVDDGDPGRLVIEPIVGPDIDLSIELYAANERAALLAEALDVDIVVESRPAELDPLESADA